MPSTAAIPRVAALTIACHPDPSRVGERALLSRLLSGAKLQLSRTEPEFASARGTSEPLRDAYLSREPIVLSRDPGGIRVDCRSTKGRVIVDGEPIDAATWITMDQLGQGVVLELAGRVALVLGLTQPTAPESACYGMIGDSEPMLQLFEQIGYAARHPAPVLLRGPSGSGKELVARAIHDASPRASGPYVSVNVAAIPETTASAELFGYQRGAFTGATATHAGWFGAAEGGTLFLDEIGETPDAVQPMLLRALETGEIQPVGAQGVRRADVRIIAATDADLELASTAGRFRFPLLQRLAGLTLRVPALAERRADIGALLLHFVTEELSQLGESFPEPDDDAARPWLGASLVGRALRYAWPGNVRELKNFARELVLSSRGRRVARAGPTFDALLPPATVAAKQVEAPAAEIPRELGDDELIDVLRANRFRVAATARALGISKNTLYQLMEKSGAIKKARDLDAQEILACSAECAGDTEAMAERLQVSERGLKLRMRELGLGPPS